MTPIDKVFMLPIDARLDYETLRRVCESGHSRIPVYEEVEVKVGATKIAKKIVGVLLVKQCVLLDPQGKQYFFLLAGFYLTVIETDETSLRSLPLNKLPSIPYDEPLLTTLDRFQEGRSHMAIVSLFSNGRAASVREAAKTGLTRRFLQNVGFGDDELAKDDLEKAWVELREGKIDNKESGEPEKHKRFNAGTGVKEQTMPADAVLTGENADDVCSFLFIQRGIVTDSMHHSFLKALIRMLIRWVLLHWRMFWKVGYHYGSFLPKKFY